MGEVYRAHDLTLGQEVALKFLPEVAARNPAALARFYSEVRIARQVSHANVCRVYDLGEVDGQPYLSMEYVDGEDLGSLLRRIGHLPSDKAIEIARQLCAGAGGSARQGRPTSRSETGQCHAQRPGPRGGHRFRLGRAGRRNPGREIRNGTPAYMAPEQLAGREVTVQSDIYSLGRAVRSVHRQSAPLKLPRWRSWFRLHSETSPVEPVHAGEGTRPGGGKRHSALPGPGAFQPSPVGSRGGCETSRRRSVSCRAGGR